MHFLCSPFGSAGDIHPMLGVALQWRSRGHDVTFIVNGYFRDVIERHGLGFIELGTADEFLASANHPDLWHPYRSFKHLYRSLIKPRLRDQYQAMVDRHVPGETVGVVNCFGFGGLVAQDHVGIPVVTLHCQPTLIWSDIAPPAIRGNFGPRWLQSLTYNLAERLVIDREVCPRLNAWRAALGLQPVRRITRWWHSRGGVVCLFPKWYAEPQADWPANCAQTDFPLWDDAQDKTLSVEVESYLASGTPPIVFTPGSANRFGSAFFAAAAEACRRLNRRGMLLSRFAEQIPRELPPGVVHFAYVPFAPLLRRAAALVHHGGVGSTAQAMAAGIPQLIMPLAHDQFDNAARVIKLGVGNSLLPTRFTAVRVARELEKLLASQRVAQGCAAIRARLSEADGCRQTARTVEDIVVLSHEMRAT